MSGFYENGELSALNSITNAAYGDMKTSKTNRCNKTAKASQAYHNLG